MPQRRTGFKALRKNERNKMHNMDLKTDLKKTVKTFLVAVSSKNKTESQTQLKTLFKKFDKAAKRNIISKNTASRRKSRFSRLALELK